MNPSQDQRSAVSLQYTALQQALRDLDAPHQRVLALRFIGHRSVPEIATLLQCSETHVKRLQYEALRDLQRHIAPRPAPATQVPSAPPH